MLFSSVELLLSKAGAPPVAVPIARDVNPRAVPCPGMGEIGASVRAAACARLHLLPSRTGATSAPYRFLYNCVPLLKERKIYARLQACVKGALSQ